MRILLILAGVALSLAAASQEIYRWVDKDGIVHYSDQPGAANAVLIDVIEPNAYEAQGAPAASAGRTSEPDEETDVSPYTSLSISSPSPDEVFFGADAIVNVSANLQGTLRPDDTLVFFLNGNRTNADGFGTEYAGLARGSYALRASVLDASGKPVITSPQTTFHVRQPSINSPQSPTAPPKPQPPKPVPKPKPTPRPNRG